MKRIWRLLSVFIGIVLCLQLAACHKTANPDERKVTETEKAQAEKGETEKPEQVTIRVLDWSDSSKDIRQAFYQSYMEKHPHVKIDYTQLTIDQYKNTILTAVKADDVPDLFPVPTGMRLAAVVADGWYQPLDPYIDEAFKNSFIDGTFIEGTTMLDGKIYSLPEWMGLPSTVLYYNKDLFNQAGLDPNKPPKTHSELREYAKKITEAGKGQFYGLIEGGKQINRWNDAVRAWSSLGGSGLNTYSPASLATGKPTFDSKAVLDVFALFQGLAEDKSIHPNTMNISAPEARALFGQGQAGFLIQGWWCVGVWKKDNPNLQLGVAAPPVPDSGRKGSVAMFTPGAWVGLSAKSKVSEEAAALLKEQYSPTGIYQSKVVEAGGAFSTVKGVNDKYLKSPELMSYYKVFAEYGRFAPDPIVRNPDIAKVYAEIKEIHPNVAELLQGVVAGAVKDPQKALKDLSERSETELARAVEAAKAKGAKVEMQDFTFPNWDPMKDYVAEDYKALQ